MKVIRYTSEFDDAKGDVAVVQSEIVAEVIGTNFEISTEGLSIELAENKWINIKVSEWGSAMISDRPLHRDAVTPSEVRKNLYKLRCNHCGFEKQSLRAEGCCSKCDWKPVLVIVGKEIV